VSWQLQYFQTEEKNEEQERHGHAKHRCKRTVAIMFRPIRLSAVLMAGAVVLTPHSIDALPPTPTQQHYTPAGFGCVDPASQKLPFCDTSKSVDERVDSLVGMLTEEEMVSLSGSYGGDLCADIDGGAARLHIPNVTQLIEVTGAVSSSCYVDPSSGESFCPTVFPAPLALAASFSRDLWRTKGAVTGQEARAFNNLHVPRISSPSDFVGLLAFGPDVNLIIDPRNGRNGENPTEDPALGGFYVEEVVRAQQEGEDPNYIQLSSALKHYAGYEQETDRFASNDEISNFDLMDTLLPPYARGLRQGRSTGTMCSYNSINSVPACAHPWLLTSLVREFWGRPDATHTSDCGAIEDQFTAKHWASSYAEATSRSVKAGTDSCIGSAFIGEHGLTDALHNESLPLTLADLRNMTRRTLAVRFRLGMFDPPNATVYTTYGKEKIHTAEAAAAAESSAAMGAVLLRNDNDVLPLRPSSAWKRVAVVGPHATSRRDLLGDFYGDAFCPGVSNRSVRSDDCVPTFGESVSNYLRSVEAGIEVVVEDGTNVAGTDSAQLKAAIAAAASADVVILCVGYNNADVEREGQDHAFTTLPGLQMNLSDAVISQAQKSKTPVVMVLINAGQVAVDALRAQPQAIIEAFYPSFGAPALVAQMFGEMNRWGRLPYTMYPAAFADAIALADMNISTGVGRTYRYYSGAAGPALYSFGHGLSYSSFNTTCGISGAGGASVTVAADSNFSVKFECKTGLGGPAEAPGDEILLVYHRASPGVRASVAAVHPVPTYSLRNFARLDNVSSIEQVHNSGFAVDPLDLALVNGEGASVLHPGIHFVDVSPRPPARNWTLTVNVTGHEPVVLSAPPPLPPPRNLLKQLA